MMKRLVLCAAVALAFSAPKAEAAFLNGAINYQWINATLSPTPGGGFGDNNTIVSPAGGDQVGPPTSGDFLAANGAGVNSTASVADFFYGTSGYVGGPLPNFVSFVGLVDGYTYTFNVTSFTTLSVAPNTGNPSALTIISGFGIWTTTNPNFEATSGGFTLTGSSIAGTDGTTYQAGGTLNAFNVPVPGGEVPEPASMMLLGSGLVGVASAARKRRKAKQAQS